MKLLIFSDVHGNLPAIEKVLKKERDVGGYINLGDVVNYGPWSNECVQLIDDLSNCINIKGNHEGYFEKGKCNVVHPLVQSFFKQTYPFFKKNKIISRYDNNVIFNDFYLTHTLNEKDYIFRDSKIDLNMNTMLGHSHQQFLRLINGNLLINPGSIGQNRKWINVSNYVLWDLDTGEFCLKEMIYDLNLMINEMILKNYPMECIEYYKNKNICNEF